MKKILSLLLVLSVVSSFVIAKDDSNSTTKVKKEKTKKEKVKKEKEKRVTLIKPTGKTRVKKDVIKDDEYAQIKRAYFDADGYGDVYNCKVEQQRFCKVKDLESGIFVLCDRDVTRTQMESAKVFYKLGQCVKLN